jgi:hypothetical protein
MKDKYLLIYQTEPHQSDDYDEPDTYYLGFPTIKEAAEWMAKYEIEKQPIMRVGCVGIYGIDKTPLSNDILETERKKAKAMQQAYFDANTKLCRISTLQIQLNKEQKSLDDNLKDLKRTVIKSRKDRLEMLKNKIEEVKLEVIALYSQMNYEYTERLSNTHRQTEAREHLWDIQYKINKEQRKKDFPNNTEELN